MGDWMKAVMAEMKAGQQILLNRLMEMKCAKAFLKANNSSVVKQKRQKRKLVKKNLTQDLDFISRSSLPTNIGHFHGLSHSPAVLHRDVCPKENEEDDNLFSELDGQDFGLLYPELKECSVGVRDLKYHHWYGPKVRSKLAMIDDAEYDASNDDSDAEEEEREVKFSCSAVLKGESENEVLDLIRLRAKVDDGVYSSVLYFHLDFKKVLQTVHVPGPGKYARINRLKTAYNCLIKEVFPWFDVKNPSASFEPSTLEEGMVSPPYYGDHVYANHFLKFKTKKSVSKFPKWKTLHKRLFPDDRKCLFCLKMGDLEPKEAGRLLYYRQNDWVHVNCALWSSEVYEEVDGSLQNLNQALNRGLKLICSYCGVKGASTGCCQEFCKYNYHFACGLKDKADYKEDKTVFCFLHKSLHTDKKSASEIDFKVARIVHVDLELENRKKVKPIDLRTVKFMVGSLTLESVGHIVANVSDSKEALIPVDFCCSRWFWSAVDPNKMIKYYCRTKLIDSTKVQVEETHFVFDHEKESETFESSLSNFQKILRTREVRKANLTILPPYAVSLEWKHLSYKDLHPEVHNIDPEDEMKVSKCLQQSTLPSPPLPQSPPPLCLSTPAKMTASTSIKSNILMMPLPSKKLNKAVGNVVIRRTPIKTNEEQQQQQDLDEDLALDDDFPLEQADNDLISAILRDSNFEEELNRSMSDKISASSLTTEANNQLQQQQMKNSSSISTNGNWSGELMKVSELLTTSGMNLEKFQSMCGMNLKATDKLPVLEEEDYLRMTKSPVFEEVTVLRTWFNQNKRRKFSEISVQCSLPFKQTIQEMDAEANKAVLLVSDDGGDEDNDDDDNGSYNYFNNEDTSTSETSESEEQATTTPPPQSDNQAFLQEDSSADNNDILSYVAENMEKMNKKSQEQQQSINDLNEMEILNKILAMSGDKIFEIGPEEQVFQLEGGPQGSEVTFSFSQQQHLQPEIPCFEMKQSSKIFQLDGQDDSHENEQLQQQIEASHRPPIVIPTLGQSMPSMPPSTSAPSVASAAAIPSTFSGSTPKILTPPLDLETDIQPLIVDQLHCQKCKKAFNTKDAHERHLQLCPDVTSLSLGPKRRAEQQMQQQEQESVCQQGTPLNEQEVQQQLQGETSEHRQHQESQHPQLQQIQQHHQQLQKGQLQLPELQYQQQQYMEQVQEAQQQLLLRLPPNKMPKIEDSRPSPSENSEASPRKDFSIAGILSPTNAPCQQPPLSSAPSSTTTNTKVTATASPSSREKKSPIVVDVEDDDVIFIPQPEMSSRSPVRKKSYNSPRKLLPKRSSPPQMRQQQHPQNVFIQHLPSLLTATSFADRFQQPNDRHSGLQYVTSINNFQSVQQQQQTLQLGSVLQPLSFPSFHHTGIIQAPQFQGFISAAPQFSYVTPQGFIVNQQPNYINLGSTVGAPQPYFNAAAAAAAAAVATPTYLTPHPSRGFTVVPTVQAPVPVAPTVVVASATTPSSVHTSTLQSQVVPVTPKKKIARVQPQPSTNFVRPAKQQPQLHQQELQHQERPLVPLSQPVVDPIKALSSMANHPISGSDTAAAAAASASRASTHQQMPPVGVNHLSITHGVSSASSAPKIEKYSNEEIDVTGLLEHHGPPPHRQVIKKTSSKPARNLDKSLEKQRSVGTQAKLGGPLKILTPRPWRGSDQGTVSSGVSTDSNSISRPGSNHSASVEILPPPPPPPSASQQQSASRCSTPQSVHDEHSYATSPEPNSNEQMKPPPPITVMTKASKTNSIKIVLQRDSLGDSFKIQEVSIKDGSKSSNLIPPKSAIQALKLKAKVSRKTREAASKREDPLVVPLHDGKIPETKEGFVNEQEVPPPPRQQPQIWRPHEIKEEGPRIMYELTSDDGFKAESMDPSEIWRQVFEAVQEARIQQSMVPLAYNTLGNLGFQMLGLTHSALAYLLEQFPEAKSAEKYSFKHHAESKEEEDQIIKENESECARTEVFKGRSPLDMFSWLASKHRQKPHPRISKPPQDLEINLSANRRATSLDLPMAMRFRHLAKNAKEAVGVFSSGIHGRGLFCKREIQAGEMVIEYAGEEIRAILTDKREKYYESRGIGCYMFKIDDDTVVDATMKGNAARFINHCCDPNCYSKIVDILGKKHIIIFALRKIYPGEELTYDYKFPIEDVKLPCACGTRKCRKYMN